MKSPIKTFLKSPYPFYYEWSMLRWLLPSIFVVGTLFLFIFQPFHNNWEEHKYPFLVICIIHSVTALLFLFPFFLIANFRLHDKHNWTVIKEITLMLFAFLAVGLGNFLIRDFIYSNENDNWNLGYLMEEIKHAFAIGLVIYPSFIWLNHFRLKLKYETAGKALSEGMKQHAKGTEKELIFYNASGTPELRLFEQQLLFIKAEGNYINVYFKKDKIEKQLIRSTLSSVAKSYPQFFNPHRSYLVNLKTISHIGGNSQGYTLHFEGSAIAIPVSRNKKAELIKLQNEASQVPN